MSLCCMEHRDHAGHPGHVQESKQRPATTTTLICSPCSPLLSSLHNKNKALLAPLRPRQVVGWPVHAVDVGRLPPGHTYFPKHSPSSLLLMLSMQNFLPVMLSTALQHVEVMCSARIKGHDSPRARTTEYVYVLSCSSYPERKAR